MYKRRNEVERLFRRLKGYRRIFSRFEKLDVMFIGFISFALIADGLRLFQQVLAAGARSRAGAADELIVADDLWGYPTHPLRAIVRSFPAPRTRTAHPEAPRPTRFAA